MVLPPKKWFTLPGGNVLYTQTHSGALCSPTRRPWECLERNGFTFDPMQISESPEHACMYWKLSCSSNIVPSQGLGMQESGIGSICCLRCFLGLIVPHIMNMTETASISHSRRKVWGNYHMNPLPLEKSKKSSQRWYRNTHNSPCSDPWPLSFSLYLILLAGGPCSQATYRVYRQIWMIICHAIDPLLVVLQTFVTWSFFKWWVLPQFLWILNTWLSEKREKKKQSFEIHYPAVVKLGKCFTSKLFHCSCNKLLLVWHLKPHKLPYRSDV